MALFQTLNFYHRLYNEFLTADIISHSMMITYRLNKPSDRILYGALVLTLVMLLRLMNCRFIIIMYYYIILLLLLLLLDQDHGNKYMLVTHCCRSQSY